MSDTIQPVSETARERSERVVRTRMTSPGYSSHVSDRVQANAYEAFRT
jgi:hypothetical protein